jgi:4-oxalocrotonate tautomerase
MPIIENKLFENRIADDDAAIIAAIIAAVTDGVCSVVGESAREQTWVVVDGISAKHWSFGGAIKS